MADNDSYEQLSVIAYTAIVEFTTERGNIPDDVIWDRPCHIDHKEDEAYETDAGTYRITRHATIYLTFREAAQHLSELMETELEG